MVFDPTKIEWLVVLVGFITNMLESKKPWLLEKADPLLPKCSLWIFRTVNFIEPAALVELSEIF